MGVFTFPHFATPSYFILKSDFEKHVSISICLLGSSGVRRRRGWEHKFLESQRSRGSVREGNRISSIALPLKCWKPGGPLPPCWRLESWISDVRSTEVVFRWNLPAKQEKPKQTHCLFKQVMVKNIYIFFYLYIYIFFCFAFSFLVSAD